MRKKVLSLLLVLAMVCSLLTVGAGATNSFSDKSTITHQEAVDVLTKAGVINGYTDGSFKPAGNVTRAQMAKMVCFIAASGDDVGSIYAGANTFTDCTSHWARGYIAFASKSGYVAGMGNGKFDPDGNVTGVQAAKMLLCLLGYDQKVEGYVGTNWAVNVLNDANDAGLLDGIKTIDMSKPLSRDNAAQMIFNALKANMVDYDQKGTTVTTKDGTVVTTGASSAKDKTNTKSDDYGKENDTVQQLCEKYFDDLGYKDKTDDFGRPGHQWKWSSDEIGTYADDPDSTLLLNKSGKTGYDVVIDDSDYLNYKSSDVVYPLNIFVNGVETTVKNETALKAFTDLKAGDLLEAYETDDKLTTLVDVRYTLAKIDAVDTSLSSTYTKKSATCSITLKDLNDSSIGGTYYDKYDNDSAKELKGFSADTYKKDAVLAVAMNGTKVLDSHVATVKTGKILSYTKSDDAKISLDGTSYPLNGTVNMSNTGDKDYKTLTLNYNDSTYTVYADKSGYVIGIDETESVKIDDVYYVTGLGKSDGTFTSDVYAEAVSLKDGSIVSYKLKDSTDNTTAFGSGYRTAATSGGLNTNYSGLYTFDKDGTAYNAKVYNTSSDSTYYVLNGAASAKNGSVESGVAQAVNGLSDDLKRDDTSLKLSTGYTKAYLNKSTNYLKIEKKGTDDTSAKFVTGGTAVDMANVKAIVVATKNGSSYTASYVILINMSKDGFQTASSDDVVYIHSKSDTTISYKDKSGSNKTGYSTELYFMDGTGKKDTVTVTEDKEIGFYTYSVNDDGVYELTSLSNSKALAAQYTGKTGTVDYDDETGYVASDVLDSVHDNTLTATKIAATSGATITLDDVDFSKNVIIADDRGSTDRDADYYTSEITSVSALKAALEKNDSNATKNNLQATVYYDNGDVIMVYVWSMDGDTTVTPITPTTTSASVTAISGSYTAGTLTATLTATAGTADTTATVELYVLNSASFVKLDSKTATIAAKATTGTAAFTGLSAGQYKVVCGDYSALVSVS